jgi:hypothetical protein
MRLVFAHHEPLSVGVAETVMFLSLDEARCHLDPCEGAADGIVWLTIIVSTLTERSRRRD